MMSTLAPVYSRVKLVLTILHIEKFGLPDFLIVETTYQMMYYQLESLLCV
jgi:hypothetical protein